MSSAANDARTGLIWARKGRGRAARAVRTLLLSAGSPAAVCALSPEEAARISGEDRGAVAPLLEGEEGHEPCEGALGRARPLSDRPRLPRPPARNPCSAARPVRARPRLPRRPGDRRRGIAPKEG